ncbi:MAG: DNA mismatch repair protein MutS [Lachnospiraceae bacterium]|nr:DNA mismatch repair protein MutS [Lachnospiraceae bacterium]
MMRQYMETKSGYMDCVLFYRLGDFYEMFFEDALLAGRELELTLTGKNAGLEKRIVMCGIPFHSYEGYMNKLVENGHKVAICEQIEDPKLAKGIVKREVIRIVTPGTNTSEFSLDESRNSYIMCLYYSEEGFFICVCDITTGDFYLTGCGKAGEVTDEIERYMPKEIIYCPYLDISGFDIEKSGAADNICKSRLGGSYFDLSESRRIIDSHFKNNAPELTEPECLVCGALLKYLTETQKNGLDNITAISRYEHGRYMVLDSFARRNLELTETLREKEKKGSLLWVMDKTKTAMGARLLRNYIDQPLLDKEMICERLDAVEEYKNNQIDREELREYLSAIYDLERLAGRISSRSANPKDLTAFLYSIKRLGPVKQMAASFSSKLSTIAFQEIDPLYDLAELIESSIVDDPPMQIKEGGIIRAGYNREVDELRNVKTDGKNWLLALEEKEKERTGIKNLRIRYNKVFGYYFEVTNSFLNMVPPEWTRKQTLTGAERFMTPELKELEDKILHAEDRLFSLEYELFSEVRERLARCIERILASAKAVAKLDCYASLGYVAERNSYVRPSINTEGRISIRDGRHPVVEQFIGRESFIGNDTELNNSSCRIAIITGPNMAGKSTYMRQTALIVLMAQCGFFVPAASADIGIADRIFTRVGASDDLASGQSTFMVEMNEVAHILKTATRNSLLILDEIGRGTSTFDGLSIAWAVVEYIADKRKCGAKTLFATHYHELTELEDKLEGVGNYCIAVKEQGEDIIFLRKIMRGGADKSYGIQVARLAGLPETVLSRAKEIAEILTDNDINAKVRANAKAVTRRMPGKNRPDPGAFDGQMSLYWGGGTTEVHDSAVRTDVPSGDLPSVNSGGIDTETEKKLKKSEKILAELEKVNINELRPLDAINVLSRLQDMASN